MAIAGKQRCTIYLDEKNVEIVRKYLATKPDSGGLSALLDKHLARCAKLIEKNPKALLEIEGGKMRVKKFIQLAKLDYS